MSRHRFRMASKRIDSAITKDKVEKPEPDLCWDREDCGLPTIWPFLADRRPIAGCDSIHDARQVHAVLSAR